MFPQKETSKVLRYFGRYNLIFECWVPVAKWKNLKLNKREYPGSTNRHERDEESQPRALRVNLLELGLYPGAPVYPGTRVGIPSQVPGYLCWSLAAVRDCGTNFKSGCTKHFVLKVNASGRKPRTGMGQGRHFVPASCFFRSRSTKLKTASTFFSHTGTRYRYPGNAKKTT
eukprot:1603584-Rhodomonas_salina.1